MRLPKPYTLLAALTLAMIALLTLHTILYRPPTERWSVTMT